MPIAPKPVVEPVVEVAPSVFIESVSDYFTGDETLQEQLRALSSALKSGAGLDECDTALYAEIKANIQAQKKARLDRQLEEVRQETVMQEAAHTTRAKDREAELKAFLEEQKTIQDRNDIAHQAKMALLAPLTETEKETVLYPHCHCQYHCYSHYHVDHLDLFSHPLDYHHQTY